MINITPKEEKIRLERDFYLRVAIFFLALLGVATIVACFAVLPSYITSLERKNFVNTQLEKQKNNNTPELDKTALGIAKDLDFKLKLMEKLQKNDYAFSSNVIDKVNAKKTNGIKITEISFDASGADKIKKIKVSGVAANREKLLEFRKLFEADSSFKSVDLPISNFIKGSNIQFYINLVIL